jgi:rubrerythrin
MNVYDYAVKMEEDTERFYRDLAVKTSDEGLKNILNMLADDELKHKDILNGMRKNSSVKMKDSEILSKSKNIFVELQDQYKDFTAVGEEIELYQKAKDIEKKSMELYQEKAKEETDEAIKKILLKIADEEHRHYHLIDNIVELLLRPKQWVEDAEFNHLEDY